MDKIRSDYINLLKKNLEKPDFVNSLKIIPETFGGPSVYFYEECLKSRKNGFLEHDHIKMIYATLTAWGMHRMGEGGKTKLFRFSDFEKSIKDSKIYLSDLQDKTLFNFGDRNHFDSIWTKCANVLKVSIAESKLVSTSKTLHLMFPDLIPPIDRQYTLRFFFQDQGRWAEKGRYTQPPKISIDREKTCFTDICLAYKHILQEVSLNGIKSIKTIDDAIIAIVREAKSSSQGQ